MIFFSQYFQHCNQYLTIELLNNSIHRNVSTVEDFLVLLVVTGMVMVMVMVIIMVYG